MLFNWVETLAVILLCDTIRKHFEDLLQLFHKLDFKSELGTNENEMSALINSLSRNVPEFTAARYFNINRSTILSLLNTLTPPKIQDLTITTPRKLYTVAMFLLHLIGLTTILMLKKWHFSQSIFLSTILRILHEAILFAYSFYTLIIAGLTKRRQWFLLVRHLERVECEINNAKSLYMIFFVSNAIYLAVSVYTVSVWTRALGFRFVNTYVFELLPVYSQFFITVSICVILKMIQSRYKHQKILLIRHFTQARKQLSYLILFKIKRSLLVLKDAVDLFNDIFGWNILLSIFFGAVRSLIYIETTVRREENVGDYDVSENYWQVAARVSYAFFYWFGIFAVILWCDAVREEFEGLLSYCYHIQECVSGSAVNENEFYAFTNSVSQNMPEFTAARYFCIDRSTIFSILNSVTTFVLVMIQFSSI
ncbi:hypothetical protein GEV33_014602 [Tenebrio molitor]|nr:hypothetical protein GEV33_014602 [Tenebrio molitor]